jgi:hypothetical protein
MMITLVPDLSTGNKQYECILLTNGEIFTCVIDSQLHSSILLGEAKFEIFFSSMTTAEFLSVFNFCRTLSLVIVNKDRVWKAGKLHRCWKGTSRDISGASNSEITIA